MNLNTREERIRILREYLADNEGDDNSELEEVLARIESGAEAWRWIHGSVGKLGGNFLDKPELGSRFTELLDELEALAIKTELDGFLSTVQ